MNKGFLLIRLAFNYSFTYILVSENTSRRLSGLLRVFLHKLKKLLYRNFDHDFYRHNIEPSTNLSKI